MGKRIVAAPVTAKAAAVDPENESHMDVFRRLASVKNMHGTPGKRKGDGR